MEISMYLNMSNAAGCSMFYFTHELPLEELVLVEINFTKVRELVFIFNFPDLEILPAFLRFRPPLVKLSLK